MRCLAYRYIVPVGTTNIDLKVDVPKGSIIRRVEARLTSVPPAYPDTATAFIDICSVLESDTTDASTWLFGQEPLIARQPVAWQGELHIGQEFYATVWCSFQSLTAGTQVELGVTIDS